MRSTRGHAIIEQVHADLRAGPLARLPGGSIAKASWLQLAVIAYNLTRAAGVLAGDPHVTATTADGDRRIRVVAVPARIATSARDGRPGTCPELAVPQRIDKLFATTTTDPPDVAA